MIQTQGIIPSSAPVSDGNEQVEVLEKMKSHCMMAIDEEEIKRNWTTNDIEGRCPMVWDGILCWGHTLAGDTATLPCPNYVVGFDTTAEATKQCLDSGEWVSLPDEPNSTWTNYSQCLPKDSVVTLVIPFRGTDTNMSLTQEKWVPIVKMLSQTGYSVSLVTLLAAFLIMASFKRLRCPRNILHMHLFASFMMRAFMSLLKDSLFVEGLGLSSKVFVQNGQIFISQEEQHTWICKLVVGLWQFFIMANYSWVLMEGMYLHNLIFLALFSDTSSITMYVILGWGLPVLAVVPWVVLRAVLEDTHCWTTNDNPLFFLIIRIPIVVSVLINFGMFVNIVRVLLLKLRSSISEETRRYRYRRWAKSTLVLVPLFGIHYTLFLGMSYSMGVNHVVEIAWLFFDLFFASFQGFFVAVLYCFMNGEVKTELTKLWLHYHKKRSVRGGRAQWWLSSGDASSSRRSKRSVRGGRAQWWLSSGDASSSRRSSRFGAALLTFPRRSRDAGKTDGLGGVMVSPAGGSVGMSPMDDITNDVQNHSSTKAGIIELQPTQVNGRRFNRLGRQLSAPVGTATGSDGSGGGLKALVKSDVIQGTMTIARKWKSRLGVGSWGGSKAGESSSPYTSAASYSCRTTHCSVDYGGTGGGGEVNGGGEVEEGLWPPLIPDQAVQDEQSSPLFQLLNPVEYRKSAVQRSLSDGIPLNGKTQFRGLCSEEMESAINGKDFDDTSLKQVC